MKNNFPKNTSEFFWTRHAGFKMRQYGLSEQRIKRVIKNPKRKEEGVAKDTVAVMQPISSKIIDGKEVWKQEIWVMYQPRSCEVISKSQYPISKQVPNSKYQKNKTILQAKKLNPKKLKIISAWRYPGVSPEKNPIPKEIISEIKKSFDLEK